MRMRKIKSLSLLLGLLWLLFSSCDINPVGADANKPTQTELEISSSVFTPMPTSTADPTRTSVICPTNTPLPSNEPGLIVTLGEKVASPWYPGIPVFSPDGQTIALATSRIRFWDVNSYQLIREIMNPYPEGCYLSNASFSYDGEFFAVSITNCWEGDTSKGHLMVWETATGDLIQEWIQEYAQMPASSTSGEDYSIGVSAMAFLPKSTKIAYANGNTIEIRDVLLDDEPVAIDLGSDMFASILSISADGKSVYALMNWEKLQDSKLTIQYKFQIWDMTTMVMNHEIKYPDGLEMRYLKLQGSYLIVRDANKRTTQALNLDTNKMRKLPYGGDFYNFDASLMLSVNLHGLEYVIDGFELWNMDTWENMYSFLPNFGQGWEYGWHAIGFSPDNTILAIEHQEQVSLWNFKPFVQP